MAKKPPPPESSDPHGRIRMIGERDESVTLSLTEPQISEYRKLACSLRDQIDQIEDQAKAASSSFKGRQKELEERERVARRIASTGRADVDVRIQEWLTRSNEVVRVNADTGEQLGPPRTARASELQESLPFDGSSDDDVGSPGSFEDA